MLRALRTNLRLPLLKSGATGEIKFHTTAMNLGFIKQFLKGDPYVTFGITAVHDALRHRQYRQTDIIKIMADSLGVPVARYTQPGPAYISPDLTATQLDRALSLIDTTIAQGREIIIATEHPGSMMALYARLAQYIHAQHGKVYLTPAPIAITGARWIDVVQGVHVMSDRGSLYHSHESDGFWRFLVGLNVRPGLIIADHGFAGAAINHQIKTIGFHDVDDVGIPVAVRLGLDVLPVPLNDNQLNAPTLRALEAIIAARRQ